MNDEGRVLETYLPKLIRLADRNLSPQLRRKVDEDDITATVLRTVIRQARGGRIKIAESEDFWRLLVAITLNKVRKKARFWRAEKRNIGREQGFESDEPAIDQTSIDPSQLLSDPTEADGEALVQTLERLGGQLDEKCRQVLSLKIEGLSHMQIAEQMEMSTRSVTRYVTIIQTTLRQANDAHDER